MTRVQLQQGYILHTRPYGDTSLLVDAFTLDHGRISLLARGQRQASKHKKPLLLFSELLLSWTGKSDLKTLTDAELLTTPKQLKGKLLYSAFYVNELLTRLVPQHDVLAEVYKEYQAVLLKIALMETEELAFIEPLLRSFEFKLLEAMGYGMTFSVSGDTGEVIAPDRYYRFVPEMGFLPVHTGDNDTGYFSGQSLLSIAAEDYSSSETRQAAKRIARLSLRPHIGDKPLKSREFFSH